MGNLADFTIQELCKCFSISLKKCFEKLTNEEREYLFEVYLFSILENQETIKGRNLPENIENYVKNIPMEFRQFIIFSMIFSVLEEFSFQVGNSGESIGYGLSIEYHINSHFLLQQQYLFKLFKKSLFFIFAYLPIVENGTLSLHQPQQQLFSILTKIIVEIFNWNFIKNPTDSILSFINDKPNDELNSEISSNLSTEFIGLICENNQFLQLIFRILFKLEDNYLFHRWSICLTKISSIPLSSISNLNLPSFLNDFLLGLTTLIHSLVSFLLLYPLPLPLPLSLFFSYPSLLPLFAYPSPLLPSFLIPIPPLSHSSLFPYLHLPSPFQSLSITPPTLFLFLLFQSYFPSTYTSRKSL